MRLTQENFYGAVVEFIHTKEVARDEAVKSALSRVSDFLKDEDFVVGQCASAVEEGRDTHRFFPLPDESLFFDVGVLELRDNEKEAVVDLFVSKYPFHGGVVRQHGYLLCVEVFLTKDAMHRKNMEAYRQTAPLLKQMLGIGAPKVG